MDKTSTLKEALHDDGSIKAVFSADGQRKVIFLSPALEAMLIDTKTGRNFEWLNCQLRPWSESDSSLAEMLDQASDDQMASSRLALAGSEHVMIAGAAPIANIHNIITHLLVVLDPQAVVSSAHIARHSSPVLGPGRVRHLRNLPNPPDDFESLSLQDQTEHDLEVEAGPSERMPHENAPASTCSTRLLKAARSPSPSRTLVHSKSECLSQPHPHPSAPLVKKVLGEAGSMRRCRSPGPAAPPPPHISRRSFSPEPPPLPSPALPVLRASPTRRDVPATRTPYHRSMSGPMGEHGLAAADANTAADSDAVLSRSPVADARRLPSRQLGLGGGSSIWP